MDDDVARDLLEALNDVRAELRRVRREGLVARLSEAEREEIADRVYERVDERLAPAELADDDAPARRGRPKKYFGKSG